MTFFLLLTGGAALAQTSVGTVDLHIEDPDGRPVVSSVLLISHESNIQRSTVSDASGNAHFQAVPFGPYRLTIQAASFAPHIELIRLTSAVAPIKIVTMAIPAATSEVTVSENPTPTTPDPTTANLVDRSEIDHHGLPQSDRQIVSLVASHPGWILEANGVLHPRGSEYQTQYVVDGFPVEDNRSPAFAPGTDPEDYQSLNILTAGYPAEYGRKLGGVIDVVSKRDPPPGFHGSLDATYGSFNRAATDLRAAYAAARFTVGGDVYGDRTDWFLDPPSPENFHNRGSNLGGGLWLNSDLGKADRIRARWSSSTMGLEVPNDPLQQENGQDQQRSASEQAFRVAYEHVLAPTALMQTRVGFRTLTADLRSNPSAVPIEATQDRGFHELYLGTSLSWSRRRHEFKAGIDGIFTPVHERFAYHITDQSAFDPDVPLDFGFQGRRSSTEVGVFLQDRFDWGPWTFGAGLRWDHYSFLVDQSSLSPRLSVVRHFARASLSVHGTYDRVFETPAIENLLLASSGQAQRLTSHSTGLAVPPSHGDFFEIGISKVFLSSLRVDVNWFDRESRNFADDDVFLNTGVSFPIAFSRATIQGIEVRVVLPPLKKFTSQLSYSNQSGTARLPITGGLLLDKNSALLVSSTGSIPVTQDQRNTLSGLARWTPAPRFWLSSSFSYGSGLPIEGEGDLVLSNVDPRVRRAIDPLRSRVKPSFSLDAQAGARLWQLEKQILTAQLEGFNLTDHFNLINFSGAFSGTALAPPRSFAIKLAFAF